MTLPYQLNTLLGHSRGSCRRILQDDKLKPGPVATFLVVRVTLIVTLDVELETFNTLDGLRVESL
jgi:hypothetical protein